MCLAIVVLLKGLAQYYHLSQNSLEARCHRKFPSSKVGNKRGLSTTSSQFNKKPLLCYFTTRETERDPKSFDKQEKSLLFDKSRESLLIRTVSACMEKFFGYFLSADSFCHSFSFTVFNPEFFLKKYYFCTLFLYH